MKFKRIYPDEQGNLWFPQGEPTYGQDGKGEWLMRHPNAGVGSLANHDVVEHEDGSITVSPSILMKGVDGEVHGHLERGVWQDA
ncbi:MAG TPA: hypothetical protein ENH04_07565 [Nitrospirae bacterium]|nr:hypothetical protein [Nitrospirota bacterium]